LNILNFLIYLMKFLMHSRWFSPLCQDFHTS